MKINKKFLFILFLLFSFIFSKKINAPKNKDKNIDNIKQNNNINKNDIEKIMMNEKKIESYNKRLLALRIILIISGILVLTYYVIKQFFWPRNDDDDEYEILINNEKELKKKIYLLQNDLKPVNFTNENNNMYVSENCPICLEDFQLNSKVVITPCNHIFHYKCFKEFFIRKNGNLCALCKYNFMSLLDGKNIDFNNVNINLNDDEELLNNNTNNNLINNNNHNNNNNNNNLIENENESNNLINNNNLNKDDEEIPLNEEFK